MEKLKMQTDGKFDKNVEYIASRFPNCVTEAIGADGKPMRVVDFDLLRQELSGVAVEGGEERYQFTWADKKKSILLANSPISKTLRPCREESVDFDTTKNLYIEGDNLDVLKLLQETYMGKVKMIYIDPPYNTGNDFVYEDNFAISAAEYFERSGAEDEDGNCLFQNNDSNGRFHTDWLNMIYPRLKLARDLLTDDGVIFISIDDNEVHNLKKICDEVYGTGNFIAEFPRVTKKGGKSSDAVAKNHDYILVYARNNNIIKLYPPTHTDEGFNNKDEYFNERGYYKLNQTLDYDTLGYVFTLDYPITINGETFYAGGVNESGYKKRKEERPSFGSRWRWSKDLFDFGYRQGFIVVKGKRIYTKTYQEVNIEKTSDGYSVVGIERTKPLSTLEFTENIYSNDNAKKTIDSILQKGMFDYTKPPELLKFLTSLSTKSSDIILDFFSGSATTAHAVMQLNAEGNGTRKFIMVQLPEETPENSEAKRAGYINICEIGKERIRRAGQKIADENRMIVPNLDIGFRVLKVDTSNMKPVFYNPEAVEQNLMAHLEDNIKDDRTPEDLLFQVMLDMGVDLSSTITVETLGGKKVFTVGGDNLICCFEKDVTKETVTAIAKRKPLYVVFRDSSFGRDDVMVSFDQIFETYSPTTTRRVI